MKIELFRNRFKVNPDTSKLEKVINEISANYGKNIEWLNIVLVNDEKMVKINEQYLNHHDYTDVITFDLSEKGLDIEGELYLSVNRVRENARKYSQTTENELNRVIIHGVLHLMGEEDGNEKQKKKMRKLENSYLMKL